MVFGQLVRSMCVRFVCGSMLMSAVVAGLGGIVSDTTDAQFSCFLAAAVSTTAFYHYMTIVALRAPREKPATPAQALFAEGVIDSIRMSDWLATLPGLIIDLHIIAGNHTKYFPVGWSVFLLLLMVALGAFVRFGTDELAPTRRSDWLVRILGVIAFLGAVVCLVLVLLNLLVDLDHESSGYIFAFTLPWIGYGLVALASITVRQYTATTPLWLSIAKDVVYGTLDVWSKAVFAMWVASRALGKAGAVFAF